ncbi:MAG: DUF2244 domain-containing protein [Gammaproteobacteria bacterium]|nr:DUF2244 domain-containing protein [Gammaproteobacteria bacterium]
MQISSFSTNTDNFLWFGRPNRSLTPSGRRFWLMLIGVNALIIALVSLMMGAWPVVPFAGIEVALVALAFMSWDSMTTTMKS